MKNIICKNAICDHDSLFEQKRVEFIKKQYPEGYKVFSEYDLFDIPCLSEQTESQEEKQKVLGFPKFPKGFFD